MLAAGRHRSTVSNLVLATVRLVMAVLATVPVQVGLASDCDADLGRGQHRLLAFRRND
jgi:hypothetical protein